MCVGKNTRIMSCDIGIIDLIFFHQACNLLVVHVEHFLIAKPIKKAESP